MTGPDLVQFDWERSAAGRQRLAGVDEAGRGCWAGPVVAAAVILPAGYDLVGLDDSKRLTARRRERLFEVIRADALSWAATAVSPADIDRINILQASLEAMRRAVARLRPAPELVLVDGRQLPTLPCRGEPLVGGDGRSAAIAAASVVAKVLRDRVMRVWDRRYPGYSFARHKGYGSTLHRDALLQLGPCPIHRRTYRPIAQLDQGRLWQDSGKETS
ncbi:MAG: ribonuclease HII [bacterium]